MNSINFGSKNSYTDWGLVLVLADIGTPDPVFSKVTVPGMDGEIDLTYALSSRLRYRMRTLTFEFAKKSTISDWQGTVRTIMGFLHGQKLNVSLSADTAWYFDADCVVESADISGRTGTIKIRCDAYPYRLKAAETVKTLTGTGTIECTNSRMPVCPTIECTEETTITFGSVTVTLSAGEHQVADIIFDEGINSVAVESTGTTTITYREGSL